MNKLFWILGLLFPVVLHLVSSNGFFYSNLFLLLLFILKALDFFFVQKKWKAHYDFQFLLLVMALFYFVFLAVYFKFGQWGGRDFFSLLILFFVLFVFLQLPGYPKENLRKILPRNWVATCLQILISFSILLLFFYLLNSNLFANAEKRFMGWSSSPTTFSIYCMWVIFFAYHLIEMNKFWRILLLIIGLIVVFLSGTRSSLLVYIIFGFSFIPILHHILRKNFFLLVVGFIFLFLFFDTISLFLFEEYMNNWLGRYKQDDDMSLLTRQVITSGMLHTISNSSFTELFFGHGINFSLGQLNSNKGEVVILAHNDFLKFIVDFGLYLTMSMFYLVFRIFKSFSGKSYIPLLIYFCSYFHNMALDHWNLFFLLLSGVVLFAFEKKY
jgi:hypothetical protein